MYAVSYGFNSNLAGEQVLQLPQFRTVPSATLGQISVPARTVLLFEVQNDVAALNDLGADEQSAWGNAGDTEKEGLHYTFAGGYSVAQKACTCRRAGERVSIIHLPAGTVSLLPKFCMRRETWEGGCSMRRRRKELHFPDPKAVSLDTVEEPITLRVMDTSFGCVPNRSSRGATVQRQTPSILSALSANNNRYFAASAASRRAKSAMTAASSGFSECKEPASSCSVS